MILVSLPYTSSQRMKAQKRLHKVVIRGRLARKEIQKVYQAMLHLERYNERLLKYK